MRPTEINWKMMYVYEQLFKRFFGTLFYLRPSAQQLINEKDLIIVEIGCSAGDNARVMLDNLDIKHLYLIDPFLYYNKDVAKYGNLDKDYKKINILLKKHKNVTLIKGFSDEVVDNTPSCLDYVYIDGNHSYEYVKKDINLYYPKVKKTGILAGHDFCGKQINDVCRAVYEFSSKKQKHLFGDVSDWWIIK